MIILVTGASHTGKTALAQKLLEKYKYPYLSIDHLKMGLIRSGNTELTPMDDTELVEYLWPIVREMIKTAIENKQNLIVEGCYIPFDWQKDFDSKYLESIKYYCLVMSEEYIKLIIPYNNLKFHLNNLNHHITAPPPWRPACLGLNIRLQERAIKNTSVKKQTLTISIFDSLSFLAVSLNIT